METMILGLEHGGRLRTIAQSDRWGSYHVFRHTWEVQTAFDLWKMATEAMALGVPWGQVEPFFSAREVNPCFPWEYADASETRLFRSAGRQPQWYAVGRPVLGYSCLPIGRGRNPIDAMASLKRSLLDGPDFPA